jgi:succinyl-CoA synthetase beta subunit
MNIHEYQAKQLFNAFGITTPSSQSVNSPQAAVVAAQSLGESPWVIKAQVHAGGRGKVGGVKLVNTLADVETTTQALLGTQLVTEQTDSEGLPIELVLVEQTSVIKREFYLSLLVDRADECLIFMASRSGGIDIEAVAQESPEQIITVKVHLTTGLQGYQCRQIAFALGLQKAQFKALETVMRGMYELMLAKDASQIEINPLIETEAGELVAIDAKINFDDNAVPIHADILALKDPTQEDEKENVAAQFDLNYIALSGTIGCMVNGAGLAMATMDLVKLKGGKPANFLDVGGGTTAQKVAAAFKLILSDSNVKAMLVNIFGGIVKCDVIAHGILAAIKEVKVEIPLVVRLAGTNAEAGRLLLSESKLAIVTADDLATAAEKVVKLAEMAA